MKDLLLLTHRIPWPPNKGDKIRSFHLLRYLAERYRVHLGTFVDDPDDLRYVSDVEAVCASTFIAPLQPRRAKLRALTGLLTGAPLGLPYYSDRGLAQWVDATIDTHGVEQAVVFSSTMAQYVAAYPNLSRVIDLVDVDSEKWRQYAASRRPPMRWVYSREGRRLLDFERRIAHESNAAVFVSDTEADLFRSLAPESAARVHAVHNGVDTGYFDPALSGHSPYPENGKVLVFTGAMDYWPNEDAVIWFTRSVFPLIRAAEPAARFFIVGRGPGRAVRALAQEPGVSVTGAVPDMRPWLGHAAVAVAPLRVARGVQNKVLEAMAMARPVVATGAALSGIHAVEGQEVLRADDAETFARCVQEQLRCPDAALAQRARARVEQDYAWNACLGRLESMLSPRRSDTPQLGAVPDALEAGHGR
ncbi:TIGR03087 family PEP-CTERM/XrtA system glycosyltransferase [Aquisalimonas sp.]|uniref:TIGR03087 family PEP-CTERM/XrtA system glycosyltransferase n=1 Tax=Aquisalimonas sp. TaxID=1872621 RepID=UPI0025BFDA55|nr:TIGR03087 family PEP-CTERM/XrtA system glycosyltransferase [Aquisalimonas sp.]